MSARTAAEKAMRAGYVHDRALSIRLTKEQRKALAPMTRGGKRKGAGRPPRKTPWASISLKVEPSLLRAWNAAKRKRRLSGPKLLALLLGE